MSDQEEARPCQYTGGAQGADNYFAMWGKNAGHRVIVISFPGHSHCKDVVPDTEVREMSQHELETAMPHVIQAGRRLNRPVPRNEEPWKLIHRNYFQIDQVDAVYAVSEFVPKSASTDPLSVSIETGTGWTCQMYVDRLLREGATPNDDRPLPLYFFDQKDKEWTAPFLISPTEIEWREYDPPSPEGQIRYAGVGTRKINANGRTAIMELLS
jgi:hypothetical protein